MKRAGLLLLMAVLAAPAQGQSLGALTCGALEARSSRTPSASQWTISGPSGKTTESGVLKSGLRFVLPILAKARIALPYRAAFDYHCRLDMPADPIQPAARADCVF